MGDRKMRIAVSGLGAVSCLGPDVASLWNRLVEGHCGIRTLTRLDLDKHRIQHGGEVPPLPADCFADVADLAVRYILASADEALSQAGIDMDGRSRTALILGTNFGAMASTERFLTDFSDDGVLEQGALHQSPLEFAMKRLALGGPGAALSLSCASGNTAIGRAMELLRSGQCDAAVAIGYDAISDVVWAGLSALRAMTKDSLRPFDARRNGTIFAEGAGALVLETIEHAQARGAVPLAEVAGYGTSSNAFHMTHPDPGGEGMVRAMKAALADAGIAPDEMDHINAHATGTKPNDKLETAAIKAVFGSHASRIAINGIKSIIGHGMGAASALEAVATVKTLQEGVIPPTIGLEEADPDCDLDYVPLVAREQAVRVALNNAAGFGGCNASVIFKRWEGVS
jgi:3-oxoacyl-(acyl-carrier-protein) synthase